MTMQRYFYLKQRGQILGPFELIRSRRIRSTGTALPPFSVLQPQHHPERSRFQSPGQQRSSFSRKMLCLRRKHRSKRSPQRSLKPVPPADSGRLQWRFFCWSCWLAAVSGCFNNPVRKRDPESRSRNFHSGRGHFCNVA